MKRTLTITLLTLALLVPACSTDAVRDFPGKVVQRLRPRATATPALAQPTAAVSPSVAPATATTSAASQPTTVASAPTQAVGTTPAAAEPSATVSTQASSRRVMLFFVALGDNGGSGQKIGCGDSLIPVDRTVQSGQDTLRTALEELLSQHDRFYGESGLYNALYQSDLKIESFVVESGTATVRLTGTFKLGGVCDGPRIQQQLTQTAIQPHLSIAREANIFVNGTPLAELVSGK